MSLPNLLNGLIRALYRHDHGETAPSAPEPMAPPPTGTIMVRPCPYCGEETRQRVLLTNRSAVTFWCSGCGIPHDVARALWAGREGRPAARAARGGSNLRVHVIAGLTVAAAMAVPLMAPQATQRWLDGAPAHAGEIAATALLGDKTDRFWSSPSATVEAVGAQAKRVAAARGVPVSAVRQLVSEFTSRDEPQVDVAALNAALDARFPAH